MSDIIKTKFEAATIFFDAASKKYDTFLTFHHVNGTEIKYSWGEWKVAVVKTAESIMEQDEAFKDFKYMMDGLEDA